MDAYVPPAPAPGEVTDPNALAVLYAKAVSPGYLVKAHDALTPEQKELYGPAPEPIAPEFSAGTAAPVEWPVDPATFTIQPISPSLLPQLRIRLEVMRASQADIAKQLTELEALFQTILGVK
jgi:hypothetical protein